MTWHEPPHLGTAGKKAGLPGRQVILLDRVRYVGFEESALDEQHVSARCQMFDPCGVFLMASHIHDIRNLLSGNRLYDVTQGAAAAR